MVPEIDINQGVQIRCPACDIVFKIKAPHVIKQSHARLAQVIVLMMQAARCPQCKQLYAAVLEPKIEGFTPVKESKETKQ